MQVSISDELWFVDGAEGEAAQKAEKSLAAAVTKAHGVRPFPMAAQKLLESLADPNFRVEDLTETIESDSSLAVRVLRVVNSPAFGLRVKCKKIGVAVTLLGPKRLSEIATAAAILDWFEDDAPAVATIFEHSQAAAAIARHIGIRCGLSPDELYTCGLLHDLGKLMLIQSGDEEYAKLALETPEHDRLHLKEREIYGFDHGVLAAHMFVAWKIPDPIPKIVAWHHQPERAAKAGGVVGKMVAALRFADKLAHDFNASIEVDEAWLDATAADECFALLNVSRDDLPVFFRQLKQVYVDSLKITLLDDVPPDSMAQPVAAKDGEAPAEGEAPPADAAAAEDPAPEGDAAAEADEAPREASAPPEEVERAPACAQCKEPAGDAACPRCGVKLCAKHAVAAGRTCARCEKEFGRLSAELSQQMNVKLAAIVLGALGGGCIVVAVLSMEPDLQRFAVLVAVFSLLGLAGFVGVTRVRVAKARARFMRVTQPPKAAKASRAAQT